MPRNQEPVSAGGYIISILVLTIAAVLKTAYLNDPDYYWALLLLLPLLTLAIYNSKQKEKATIHKHSIFGYLLSFLKSKRVNIK